MARSKDEQYISTRIRDAESAGLPDDIDVTIKKSLYAVRSNADYKEDAEIDDVDAQGKPSAVPVWVLTLQPGDGDEFDLIESCGSIKRVVPSDDGLRLKRSEANTAAKGISNTCKAFYLLESMVDCEDSIDEKANTDISSLEGMKFHLLRKPAPKSWAGLAEPEPGPDGRKARARTIETCSSVLSVPWKKGSGKATAQGKAGKKQAAPEPETSDEDAASDAAKEIVEALLADDKYAEKGIKVSSLFKLVHPEAKKSDHKDAIIELVQDDDWLGGEERPWTLEDGIIKGL